MKFSKILYIILSLSILACGEPSAAPGNIDFDPSDLEAIKLFKQANSDSINSSDLYGLWEAPLGKGTGVIYTSRLLIEKNFVTLAVKCSFHTPNGLLEEELFALSNSEAIITRSQILIERQDNQTIKKAPFLCTSRSGLIHSQYLIDHKKKQLVLKTSDGILRLYKISDLQKK